MPQVSVQQLGFHVDMEKCIGCKVCEAACNDFYRLPPEIRWRRVRSFEAGDFPQALRVHLTLACNHCTNPVCLQGCPVGAYTKREADGVVIQNPERCIGCQYCTWTCPYGAPKFNPEVGVVSKCNACYQRLDESLPPRCVEACLTGAVTWGKVDEHTRRQRQALKEAPGFPDPGITGPSTRFAWPLKGPQPESQEAIAPPGPTPASANVPASTRRR